MDYSRNIEEVGIVLSNKILNYIGIKHEMKEVDHTKYMKYTTNSNHFHLNIKLEINENNFIKKKLIIGNNITFKMTGCGCEGCFDKKIEENEMEDVEIEEVNIASVNLNSSKRKIFYEINWI